MVKNGWQEIVSENSPKAGAVAMRQAPQTCERIIDDFRLFWLTYRMQSYYRPTAYLLTHFPALQLTPTRPVTHVSY